MSLIVADNLTKTYTTGTIRVEALKDLTFTIDRAWFVTFIGPSGSGKTTLLNLIDACSKPCSGDPCRRTADGTYQADTPVVAQDPLQGRELNTRL